MATYHAKEEKKIYGSKSPTRRMLSPLKPFSSAMGTFGNNYSTSSMSNLISPLHTRQLQSRKASQLEIIVSSTPQKEIIS